MDKLNCWQHMGCGREPGGEKAEELGVCPAATEKRLEGVNDGNNGGRTCWVIAGTMCNGKPQGTFADKFRDCAKCEFFLMVRNEQGEDFVIATLDIYKKP